MTTDSPESAAPSRAPLAARIGRIAFLVVAGRAAVRREPGDDAPRPPVLVRPDTAASTNSSHLRLLLVANPTAEEGRGLTTTVLAAPGSSARGLVLRRDEECPVLVDAPLSGEAEVLVHTSASLRPELSHLSPFVQAPPLRISVLPSTGGGLPQPVAARLRGITGNHASRRPGDGGELRTIAPLQAGDRLQRIDWRATARRSADQDRLMVRRSYADADASVFLVLDEAQDLPASTGEWFARGRSGAHDSSLHRARVAAATIAASYLAGGDRVGLDDLSGARRSVRSAAGRRHLEQLRARLAATSAAPRRRRRRDPVPPPGSFVVLFSAFLDDEPGRLLSLWHSQGHLVAGVDCAPELQRTESTRAQTSAVRLTLLRRRLRLEDLQGAGIPVLAATSTDDTAGSSPDSSAPTALLGLEAGLRVLSRRRHRSSGGRTR